MRLVTRRVPLEIPRTVPLSVSPQGRRSVGTPPPGVAYGKLRIVGFMHITWNTDDITDWTPATGPSSTWAIQGYNYATWKAALSARILARGGTVADEIVESTQNGDPVVQFKGECVFDFASMCDIFIAGHALPNEMVSEIRSRSRLDLGTQVLFGFFNFESINQSVCWNPGFQTVAATSRPFVLVPKVASGCTHSDLSPTQNGWTPYKCNVIDKYEDLNSLPLRGGPCLHNYGVNHNAHSTYPAGAVACPHTPQHSGLPEWGTVGSGKHCWDIDVRSNTYIRALTDPATGGLKRHDQERVLEGGGGGGGLLPGMFYQLGYQGQLWDNFMEDPYAGAAATAEYPVDYDSTAYRGSRNASISLRTGWKGFSQSLHELYSPQGDRFIWANAPDRLTAYTAQDIKNRFVEFFFRDNTDLHKRTLAELYTVIDRLATAGCRCIMGLCKDGRGDSWATSPGGGSPVGTYGTWADLLQHISNAGQLDNFYVQACRAIGGGTNGSWIFWQPEFRPLA